MSHYLVTGSAGFIGMHTVEKLLLMGHSVVGVDNLNDYYDPLLKQARLNKIYLNPRNDSFEFIKLDISNNSLVSQLFENYDFDGVIHLAAQAGVRYSLENPHAYINSNITGFINILEGMRLLRVRLNDDVTGFLRHLVYASSSSVYGGNNKLPFSESDAVDHPISLYAATKKSNELMAHTYAHLFGIPSTGLRFFTVYGPWGRPDMAAFLFTKAILSGDPIKVYNYGQMERDFTYIDDIVNGISKILPFPPLCTTSNGDFAFEFNAPHRVLNIGNNKPEPLSKFISAIEESLNLKAIQDLQPMQAGDVKSTYADISAIMKITGFEPNTSLRLGISKFIHWYKSYYNI